MHELSIAQHLIDNISNSIKDKPVHSISQIYITIGALSGISSQALDYCFQSMDKPPLFTNSQLIINLQPIVIYCSHCQQNSEIQDEYALICPNCDRLTNNIIKGKELIINHIEVNYDN